MAGLSSCLELALVPIAVLCMVLASGRSGWRCMDAPVEVGTAREQPLVIGSFSSSRISIFLVRFAKFKELMVSKWYDLLGAKFNIITVRPLFCPSDKILVILLSLYGILA